MLEAGEVLGMSERQFRRYRDRYEEEGLEGLRTRNAGPTVLSAISFADFAEARSGLLAAVMPNPVDRLAAVIPGRGLASPRTRNP